MMRRYSELISNAPFKTMIATSLLFYIIFYFNSTRHYTLMLAVIAVISYFITSSVILHIKYFTHVARFKINTVFDYRFPSFHSGVTANLVTVYDYYAYYYTNTLLFYVMFAVTITILVITAYARHYSNHHTVREIIVGIMIGVIVGVLTCTIKIF